MGMLYKEDVEKAKERISAWWHGEIIDRPAVSVTAPKDGIKRRKISMPFDQNDLISRWTNIEYNLEVAEEDIRCTYWGGEALPSFMPNLGPSIFTAWLGCELKFGETTSWTEPAKINNPETFSLNFDRNNKWWKLIQDYTRDAAIKGKDKFFVKITDLHPGGDALSAMTGAEDFCMDIILYPDKVKEWLSFVNKMWFEVYEVLDEITKTEGQEGGFGWISWAPGKTYPVSDDILALISPKMFKDFFWSGIKGQVEYLDYAIFHLDGHQCIVHLDLLFEIPKLRGIQWVHGAGHGPMTKWIPFLKEIQKKGKILHLTVEPGEIEQLLSELSAKGVMFETCCSTEEEARNLLKKIAGWSVKKG